MSKILTLEIAQKFLNPNLRKELFGGGVHLQVYTSIDDAAAQALAQHEGTLYLSGEAEEAVNLRKRLPSL